ncbi:MAG: YHS domain-containing (seleno)protein [Gemmatimonadaceae bacterium]
MRRVAALTLVVATTATAALAQHGQGSVNVDDNGVILAGHDAVAYQSQSRPIAGSTEFTAVHEGAIYRFASAANRDAFKADPAKYAPAYGGYCAMGVAMGKKLPVDPAAFTVANGRLFLNVNRDVQSMFSRDVAGNNAKAAQNWQEVRARRGFDRM